MSSIEREWLSLIGEVQKLVLKEEAGSVLFAEEEAYNFFHQKHPAKQVPARLESPALPQKTQPFPPPRVAPAAEPKEPFRPQVSAPRQEAVKESLSEDPRPAGPPPPSFDYKMMRETISKLKPSLKILEEIKEGTLAKKDPPPACLLVGGLNDQEQQMMDSIQGAIGDVLKQTAKTYPVHDKASVEALLATLSSPHLKLIIISEESLKENDALQSFYKPAEEGKPAWFGDIPAAPIPSFRSLKDSPAAKRALWNLIKSTLKEAAF
ncbi:hypothetical protein [Estrella lausannensis]|uniref:Uncharacterized protein n=1 Tax=Estrella lausannensis TaxID=483423 RepID=A0A0H5E5H6_9BACT|nr:hypothetical protein [Estrella lausannensis]CRX38480.1 hypothetical protein ELAC_1137 [Estrella lausannensis]